MVDVSLLPKEFPEEQAEEQAIKVSSKGVFPTKFLVIGILIIIVAAVITGGIFIYQKARASTLNGLENQIANLKIEESKYTVMEQQAKNLQDQLNTLSNLIEKHKYWSQVIKALADYTPQSVNYKNIIFDQKSNKFVVAGGANDYESVSRLMVSLKKMDSKEYFDSIELIIAKLNKTLTPEDNKNILFTINFNLKEGALKQTTQTKK